MNTGSKNATICGLFSGIYIHACVIDDLCRRKEIGVEKQTETATCASSGKLIPLFKCVCPRCKS